MISVSGVFVAREDSQILPSLQEIHSLNPFAFFLRHVASSRQNCSHHKLLPCIPARPWDQLHELNYRAKKSLSGIKIQGIDGAIDTLPLSIVSSPVHSSIEVVKPAGCFQVNSPPAGPQLFSRWGGSMVYMEHPAGYCNLICPKYTGSITAG